MFALTRQERLVVIFFIVILFTGTVFHYFSKKNPQINRFLSVLDNERLYHRLDLNQASYEELVSLPLIGPAMANRIMAYREENGPFTDLEQIKNVQGIGPSNYRKISGLLKIPRKK